MLAARHDDDDDDDDKDCFGFKKLTKVDMPFNKETEPENKYTTNQYSV